MVWFKVTDAEGINLENALSVRVNRQPEGGLPTMIIRFIDGSERSWRVRKETVARLDSCLYDHSVRDRKVSVKPR